MEIQGKNGSKTLLKVGVSIDFGRGLGFDSDDRKVSRHHITFQLHEDETKVGFDVTGKNPIWVHSCRNGEIRVYRMSERGEMESGDMFCVSAKNPVWFNLKRIELESREPGFDDELTESLQSSHGLPGIEDLEMEDGDLSNIDPIKEFGFVVMGHEFDGYPKKLIHDSKKWNWFLEEDGEKSDDDEDSDRKQKKRMRKKRKKGEGNDEDEDDDDWTGESEDDAELITKLRNVQKPKYSTRSKDHNKGIKGTRVSKKSQQKDTTQTNETDTEDTEEAEEDEDDETLGGFIVDDEGAREEEEINEDEEDEEEFDDDEE